MNRTANTLASIGLAIGALFGVSGSLFTEPTLQIALYQISSVALTAACALLTVRYLRAGRDYVATGFLLFAIGEAVMSAGTALGQIGGQAAFAAGMALYVPALLFISVPDEYAAWCRFTGVAATVPFTIAASKIYLGGQALSTSAFPGAGYGLLTLTIAGWIMTLLRERSGSPARTDRLATAQPPERA